MPLLGEGEHATLRSSEFRMPGRFDDGELQVQHAVLHPAAWCAVVIGLYFRGSHRQRRLPGAARRARNDEGEYRQPGKHAEL
jgi:hypothetical protein